MRKDGVGKGAYLKKFLTYSLFCRLSGRRGADMDANVSDVPDLDMLGVAGIGGLEKGSSLSSPSLMLPKMSLLTS